MTSLKESSCSPISASASNLMWYIILVGMDEENLAPHKYLTGKGRSVLIAFSDHSGCSFLIWHPNSTSGSFLKAAFLKVGGFWKHIRDFFVLLCFTVHWPALYCVLVIWKIWIHWAMQTFQTLTHFIIQCQTTTFISITTDVTIKLFKYWYTLKLKLFSHCKAGILLLAVSAFSCFPVSGNLTLFILETVVCQTPTSEQAPFVFK